MVNLLHSQNSVIHLVDQDSIFNIDCCMMVAESSDTSSVHDPELRSVLVLATDSELYEVERILFGPR